MVFILALVIRLLLDLLNWGRLWQHCGVVVVNLVDIVPPPPDIEPDAPKIDGVGALALKVVIWWCQAGAVSLEWDDEDGWWRVLLFCWCPALLLSVPLCLNKFIIIMYVSNNYASSEFIPTCYARKRKQRKLGQKRIEQLYSAIGD